MRNHYLAGLGLLAAVAVTAVSCNDKPDEFPQPAYQAPSFPPFPAGNEGIGSLLPINNLLFQSAITEFRSGSCNSTGSEYRMELASLGGDTLTLTIPGTAAPAAGSTINFGPGEARLEMTMSDGKRYETISGSMVISHEPTASNIQANLSSVVLRQIPNTDPECPFSGACVPTGPNATNLALGFGITNVNIAGITTLNNSTSANPVTGSETGYENFSCTQGVVLQSGSSYPLTVTTANSEKVRVYIDFNDNGKLDDTGELVLTSDSGNNHSSTITVPVAASMDRHLRMRVISEPTTVANMFACGQTVAGSINGTLTSGQAEDYFVVINPDPSITFTVAGRLRCP